MNIKPDLEEWISKQNRMEDYDRRAAFYGITLPFAFGRYFPETQYVRGLEITFDPEEHVSVFSTHHFVVRVIYHSIRGCNPCKYEIKAMNSKGTYIQLWSHMKNQAYRMAVRILCEQELGIEPEDRSSRFWKRHRPFRKTTNKIVLSLES